MMMIQAWLMKKRNDVDDDDDDDDEDEDEDEDEDVSGVMMMLL